MVRLPPPVLVVVAGGLISLHGCATPEPPVPSASAPEAAAVAGGDEAATAPRPRHPVRDAWDPGGAPDGDATGTHEDSEWVDAATAPRRTIPRLAAGRWAGETEILSPPRPTEVSVRLHEAREGEARVGEVVYRFDSSPSCRYGLEVTVAGAAVFTVRQRAEEGCPGRGDIRFRLGPGDSLLGEWYHPNGGPWFAVSLFRVGTPGGPAAALRIPEPVPAPSSSAEEPPQP